MCDAADDAGGIKKSPARHSGRAGDSELRTLDLRELMPVARALAAWREKRDSHVGFVGYGNTTAGNKVLIAVDREYDPTVPQAVAQALREKGAHVDLLFIDMGEPDREFDYLDEVRVIMRREPWENNPRRWEGLPFIEDFAARRGYDLLIHGKGGPVPKTDYLYEQILSLQSEHFLQRSTTYPLELHLLINQKTWEPIWEKGRGGRARLTGPEGTDICRTYWEEYYDGSRYGFSSTPRNGHLFSPPVPPLIEKEDAAGVVAGTTSHFSRAFPQVRVELEGGQIVKILGGAAYGDAWRDLFEQRTR